MLALIRLFLGSLVMLFRSRAEMAAENLALRHQLGILLRSRPARLHLTSWDRALWTFVLQRSSSWRLGQQTVNAFSWNTAPKFLIRDRDRAYGCEFSRRVRDLGILAIKTAIRALKMNCYAERLIGTIRRELFDHVIVSSERHARRQLREFQVSYNEDRLHLALEKDDEGVLPEQSLQSTSLTHLDQPRRGRSCPDSRARCDSGDRQDNSAGTGRGVRSVKVGRATIGDQHCAAN